MSTRIDDTLAKKGTRLEKAGSPDSTCSMEKETLKSPKDVLALGQAIVRQLELEDRGAVLERWLAHHLSEVIAEADRAVGPAKAASEAQAVHLVLKLWAHRRALPEPVDPLGGYRKAVEVLGRLVPEANPWAYRRRSETYDGLLREMFELLSRIVLAGLLLTQVSRARPVTEEEYRGLEDEELYLQSVFEQWIPFFPRPQSRPDIKMEFVGADTAEDAEIGTDRKSERIGDSDNQDGVSDEQATPTDARLHAAIVSDLEGMQNKLTDLLARWRKASPCEPEGKDENSAGLSKNRVATAAGSLDAFGDGEVVGEKTEADTAGEESTQSDRARSFWSSLSLTELAQAQGIAPVDDLEALAALWPSENDPDELLEHLLADRAARRRVVGSDPER